MIGNYAERMGGGIGAIDAGSDVTLVDYARIYSNTAGIHGGGIYALHLPYVTIVTNASIEDNYSVSNGGGIYLLGESFSPMTLYIDNADVLNNRADSGGGLYARAAVVNIQNTSVFSGNLAIHNGGGAHLDNDVETTIDNADFVNNRAIQSSFWNGLGGAIYNRSYRGLTLRDVTASGNSADVAGGALYTIDDVVIENSRFERNSAEDGGAIYIEGAIMHATNSIFGSWTLPSDGNKVTNDGGGLYAVDSSVTLTNSVLSRNESDNLGGGVYINGGSFNMVGGGISNNKVLGDSGLAYGGGLYATGEAVVSLAQQNSQNRGLNGYVGGNEAVQGGGIYAGGQVALNLYQIIVDDNEAVERGGGLYALGTTSIEFSAIKNNVAEFGAGMWVFNQNIAVLTILNSTIEGNQASNAGGGAYIGTGTEVDIQYSDIVSNGSQANYAGMLLSKTKSLVFRDNNVRFNVAGGDGGGISVFCVPFYAAPLLRSNTVRNNSAENGGGVFTSSGNIEPCEIHLENMNIYDNFANGDGGGLYVEGNAVTMRAATGNPADGGCQSHELGYDAYCSLLDGNYAERGGAVFVAANEFLTNTTYLKLETTAVIDNSALSGGSGIYLNRSSGAVYDAAIDVYLENVYMRGNLNSPVIQTMPAMTHSKTVLRHVTSAANADSPIWLDFGSSGLTNETRYEFYNSALLDNATGPFVTGSFNACSSSNSHYQPLAAGSGSGCLGSPFTGDPEFVTEPGRGPHRLSASSPLVNIITFPSVTLDADQQARPAGGAHDMGAFERDGVPLAVTVVSQSVAEQSVRGVLFALFVLMGVTVWVRPNVIPSPAKPNL